jgi:polysaccharide export outer membrane protein
MRTEPGVGVQEREATVFAVQKHSGGTKVKTLWAVACAVLVVAGAFVLGGGCASTKSQMTDFSRMDVGDGPGATLKRLTELQKAPGDQRDSPKVDKTSTSDSAKAAKTTPASSRNVKPPTEVAAKKTQTERGKKAQKAKSKSKSSETASSKATAIPEVPPAKPSEPSRKEDPPSGYISRFDNIVNTKTANRSMASSSGATTEAKSVQETKTESPPIPTPSPRSMVPSSGTTAVATPVQTAKTEAPPIPAPSLPKAVPPLENTERGEKTSSAQTSAGQIAPAVAPPASTAGKAASSADAQYRIGREDVLNVTVWGNEKLTMDVVVRPDGKISLPLIQDIEADGFTASELADRIRNKFLPYIKDPNVSVIVKQINAPKFSVIGYVNRPGTFPMRGDVTVLQALSEAGGFTPFASPRKIKLVRNAGGKQEVRVLNYYDLIDKGGEGSFLIKAGDTIVVP